MVGRGRGTPGQHHDAAPLKLGDCVDSTGHWVTGDTGQCCVQLQLWTVDMWHRSSEPRTGLSLVRAPGPLSGAAPATSLVLTTTPGRRSARPRRGVSTELPSLLHSSSAAMCCYPQSVALTAISPTTGLQKYDLRRGLTGPARPPLPGCCHNQPTSLESFSAAFSEINSYFTGNRNQINLLSAVIVPNQYNMRPNHPSVGY